MSKHFRYGAIGTRVMGLALLAALAACSQAPEPPAAPSVPPTELLAVDTPVPGYPEELLCDNVGGQVVLSMVIGVDGKPGNVQVHRSSGVAALDQAALAGVRNWTFKPATRGGQAHSSNLQVPVNFKPPAVRPDACFALDEKRRRAGG